MIKKEEGYILRKAERICKNISDFLVLVGFDEFYLAGSCLNKDFHDIDIFPLKQMTSFDIGERAKNFLVSETDNAFTFRWKGIIIQICNYIYPSLKSLILSFDFSHIQVGCFMRLDPSWGWKAIDIYYTEDYVTAKIIQDTYYTSSDYPLSSLIRVLKYYKRNQMSREYAVESVVNIISDIVSRGFDGSDDFRNQLNVVKAGLLDSEVEKLEHSKISLLYKELNKSRRTI